MDVADFGRDGDRPTPRDDRIDRLVVDKAITAVQPACRLGTAARKPDGNRIGL
jgi:hypothetical protein